MNKIKEIKKTLYKINKKLVFDDGYLFFPCYEQKELDEMLDKINNYFLDLSFNVKLETIKTEEEQDENIHTDYYETTTTINNKKYTLYTYYTVKGNDKLEYMELFLDDELYVSYEAAKRIIRSCCYYFESKWNCHLANKRYEEAKNTITIINNKGYFTYENIKNNYMLYGIEDVYVDLFELDVISESDVNYNISDILNDGYYFIDENGNEVFNKVSINENFED